MSAQQRFLTVPDQLRDSENDGMVDLIILEDEPGLGNAPPLAVAVVALVCLGIGLAVGATLF
jgi:hypothetical protein